MAYQDIIYEKKNRIAYITINRPKKMNAMSALTSAEYYDAVHRFQGDPDAWVLIVSGAGDRAFSSGHDLSEDTQEGFDAAAPHPKLEDPASTENLEIWKPTIGAIRGYCLAGGLELAMQLDMRISSEDGKFGLSEVLRSLVPGGGGPQRLPRIVPMPIALEILLTGDMIDAQEAYRIGLVNHVVPSDQVMRKAEELALKICANGPLAVRAIKQSAMKGVEMPLSDALALNTKLYLDNYKTEDAKEGPLAFIEKRPAKYRGR
jgi:enoyl-CoA hydratase/carnithine racemase